MPCFKVVNVNLLNLSPQIKLIQEKFGLNPHFLTNFFGINTFCNFRQILLKVSGLEQAFELWAQIFWCSAVQFKYSWYYLIHQVFLYRMIQKLFKLNNWTPRNLSAKLDSQWQRRASNVPHLGIFVEWHFVLKILKTWLFNCTRMGTFLSTKYILAWNAHLLLELQSWIANSKRGWGTYKRSIASVVIGKQILSSNFLVLGFSI